MDINNEINEINELINEINKFKEKLIGKKVFCFDEDFVLKQKEILDFEINGNTTNIYCDYATFMGCVPTKEELYEQLKDELDKYDVLLTCSKKPRIYYDGSLKEDIIDVFPSLEEGQKILNELKNTILKGEGGVSLFMRKYLPETYMKEFSDNEDYFWQEDEVPPINWVEFFAWGVYNG